MLVGEEEERVVLGFIEDRESNVLAVEEEEEE